MRSCDIDGGLEPTSFIGYEHLTGLAGDIVRVYINCKDRTHYDGSVDVVFAGREKVKFVGLEELSMIKKFNRFINCLEERAREQRLPRERIFESSAQVLTLLKLVKNSRDFGSV